MINKDFIEAILKFAKEQEIENRSKVSVKDLSNYFQDYEIFGLTLDDYVDINPILDFFIMTSGVTVDNEIFKALIDTMIITKQTEIKELPKLNNRERLLIFFENNPDFKQLNLKFYDYVKNDKFFNNQEFDIIKLLDKFKFLESLEEQENKAKEGNIKLDELEDKEELFKILKSVKEYKPENPDIVSRIVVDKNILQKEKFNETKDEINDIRASMTYITDQKKLQSIFDEFIIKYKEHPHLKMLLKDLIIYVMNHL